MGRAVTGRSSAALTKSKAAPTRRRRLSTYAKLVDLIPDEGWKDFALDCGRPGTDREQLKNDIKGVLDRMSRTGFVEAVMNAMAGAIVMLNEVLLFLSAKNVLARTTGEVATLPELNGMTAQQRRLALSWSDQRLREFSGNSALRASWNRARSALDRMLEASHVRAGPLPSYCRLTGIRGPRLRVHDVEAFNELSRCAKQLRKAIPRGSEVTREALLAEVDSALSECEHAIGEIALERPDPAEDSPFVDLKLEQRAIHAFIEELKLTADEDPHGDAVDLLSLAVFRKLPQLYEVWVLCYVLSELELAGHEVRLEQVAPIGRETVWNLKYSRATDPVAIVGGKSAVTFQLYDPTRHGMPDMAIHEGPTAASQPMLIVDPKFSRAGYGMGAYRSTGEEYRTAFGAPALVVEYYHRDDATAPPFALFDVRPGSETARLLRMVAVAVCDGPRRVCVIDASESYTANVDVALKIIKNLALSGLVDESCIVFAGEAERRKLDDVLEAGSIDPPNATPGTNLDPLRACMQSFSTHSSCTFLLFSDGDFGASNWTELTRSGLSVRMADVLPPDRGR